MAKRTAKKQRRYVAIDRAWKEKKPSEYTGGGIVTKPGVSGTPLMR